MSKADGGPAFPTAETDFYKAGDGMTLRDYFASQALVGLIAQSNGTALGSDTEAGAIYCYRFADDMLKARER